MKISIKATISLISFFILFSAFHNPFNNDPNKYLNQGKSYYHQKQYIKAIGEFTMALSIQDNLAEAYYYRGLSKDLHGKENGYYNPDFCYDLISAMKYGFPNAIKQLYERGLFEAVQLNYTVDNPESVLCVELVNHQISSFPESIDKMTQLISINLNNNKIKAIDTDFCTHHPNLIALNLSQNYIEKVPEELDELQYLYELNLSQNKIKELPHSIYKLTHLSKLNLRGNHISHISHQISELKSLKVLNLSLNQLTKIPKEFYDMKNLETLDLSGNLIPDKEIEKLKLELGSTHIIH
ncbi:leucine-rich repeat domain-containing protein [Flammeovirga yaeyamensis]|uniref:Leucine-rich repeat domain-containing protein n=1 Tax=Flammeovirga yaeyamensis TaxID=367791 RepID=A0AAX1N6I2_9BACT|nr:leucine-rich repeat domain-containing protein [Flammeovirga yaeyamensis]MBB3697679.1 tetratricopeptide (TPR) repeat protein [Flammeovirga yaeyamensis]NMF35961.1 leucine-rich repeat domain-containing protein [Flammeovirga yaeyamensis]QWG03091.1 leucine-rich repeat domain-containing protein [Flammeovirga yaeyamensis]